MDVVALPDSATKLILAAQRAAPEMRLVGGAGLALLLEHRRSNDLDLFCSTKDDVEIVARAIEAEATGTGTSSTTRVRTAPSFVRFELTGIADIERVDVALDSAPRIADVTIIEGIRVESLRDQRANKIVTILGRSELRDLVDLYFLEKNGWPLLEGLDDALLKDGGVDPAWLAWAIGQVAVRPLPGMQKPLDLVDLERFRDRMRRELTDLAGASG